MISGWNTTQVGAYSWQGIDNGTGVVTGTARGSSKENGLIDDGKVTGYTDMIPPWQVSFPRSISNSRELYKKKNKFILSDFIETSIYIDERLTWGNKLINFSTSE